MTQMTSTQEEILRTAAERPRRILYPLPDRIRGGAVPKVIASLLRAEVVEEVEAQEFEEIYQMTDDGCTTLVVSDAGLAAIGLAADKAPTAAPAAAKKAKAAKAPRPARKQPACKGRDPRTPPTGTVLAGKHKGQTYEATVADDGFVFDGRSFRSLSAIAKEITGGQRNGWTFFGLAAKNSEAVS